MTVMSHSPVQHRQCRGLCCWQAASGIPSPTGSRYGKYPVVLLVLNPALVEAHAEVGVVFIRSNLFRESVYVHRLCNASCFLLPVTYDTNTPGFWWET